MFWDIALAIGIGLSQLGLTLYGVLVSVKRHHRRIATVIGLVGLAGIVLTAIATIRSGQAQQELREGLTTIKKNTEQPPQITVNIPQSAPPMVIVNPPSMPKHRSAGFLQLPNNPTFVNADLAVGSPLSVNIGLANKGTEPVHEASRFFGAMMKSVADPKLTDKQVRAEFLGDALKSQRETTKGKGQTFDVPPGAMVWNTLTLGPLQQEHIDGILRGTTRLYVYAWARWKDGEGDFEQCLWLQAPTSASIANERQVWHLCEQ
jgi:hypothetical protein